MANKLIQKPLEKLGMEGTKWDFFVAGVNLFVEKGYNNVAVHEIAATLDKKAASMYNHFSSKDELLEKMYEFFLVNYEVSLPSIEELLKLIPHTPPREVLRRFLIPFGDDPQQLMPKIMYIIIEERNRDTKAEELAEKVFMLTPRRYAKIILEEMVAEKVIEPLDIDSLAVLISSLDFYGAYTYGSKFALNYQEWMVCHELLCEVVKPIEKYKGRKECWLCRMCNIFRRKKSI